ncbi:MAG: DUF2281 domain-containing protein [Candidatus Wallbacteria bacterium]|nr:DUF2281 domain-containing protein [Candidatus Wallbacteria bacterium]
MNIESKIRILPNELRREVLDFIDFLLAKRENHKGRKPSLEWIGGLSEFQGKFTAMELQKKSLDWRD